MPDDRVRVATSVLPSRNSTVPAGAPATLETVALSVTWWKAIDDPRAVEVGVAATSATR